MVLRWEWSVPANLLIAGEYAITQEDGLGVSIAVEPRAHARVRGVAPVSSEDAEIARSYLQGFPTRPDSTGFHRYLTVLAISGEGTYEWPSTPQPLVSAVVAEVAQMYRDDSPAPTLNASPELSADDDQPRWQIELDTRAFYHPETNEKLGLGSSAAATVLLVAALMRLAGDDPVERQNDAIACAIRAHRRAHHGRGSGYDIATSALGGALHFVGGHTPQWVKTDVARNWAGQGIRVYTMAAGKPVRSSSAVERFTRFLPKESEAYARFLHANATVVHHLQHATSWPMLFRSINAARGLGEDLGEQIGVSAAVPLVPPHVDDGWAFKASGAGNERVIIFAINDCRRRIPAEATALRIAEEGLRWEYNAETTTSVRETRPKRRPHRSHEALGSNLRRLKAPTPVTRPAGPYPAACMPTRNGQS